MRPSRNFSLVLALAATAAITGCDKGPDDTASAGRSSDETAAAANTASQSSPACGTATGEAAANCQQGVRTLKAMGSALTSRGGSDTSGSVPPSTQ